MDKALISYEDGKRIPYRLEEIHNTVRISLGCSQGVMLPGLIWRI